MTSRVPLLEIEEAERRSLEMDIPVRYASLNLYRAFLHQPRLARAFGGLLKALLDETALDVRLRELAVLRVAWQCRSAYVWAQHWKLSQRLGIPEAELAGVRDWDGSAYGEAEQAVLSAVDELCATDTLSDGTWTRLGASLSDPVQCIELIAAVAHWRMIAGLQRALAIPLDRGLDEWPPDGRAPHSA